MEQDRKHPFRVAGQRLARAIGRLWRSEQGHQAAFAAAALVVMIFTINGLNVINSYVGRDFMSAIEKRNVAGFRHQALLYAGVFIASSAVAALYRFMEERLGILWRKQLTWRLADSYLNDRVYYRLTSATGVANPDQRITDDVRAFTTTTLSFLLLFLNGTVTVLSFSGVLWSISPLLFGVAVAYASVGTIAAVLLGRPLVHLNYDQLDMEANFRSDLIHIRENSESIALAHREGRFKTRLKGRLDALTRNLHRIIRVNLNLGLFTNGYNYFIQIIPALLIAPLFMAGQVQFGVITQSTMAFATLLGAFSLIVTQFQSISAFTAVTARLQTLSDAIERAHRTRPCSIVQEDSPDRVRYEDVTLRSADDSRVLVENLNLDIPKGARILCTSHDAEPRVALFRATAGVWNCGTGRIVRPGLEEVLFLPERPYLPPGTLRHILLRSGMEKTTADAAINKVLSDLGLEETVARVGGLDASKDWDDILSIGEQHMLSIARIFLANPAFVFLDRPESAMPRAQVSRILDMLSGRGMGVVVFAEERGAPGSYNADLVLGGQGKWEVTSQADPELMKDIAGLKQLSC